MALQYILRMRCVVEKEVVCEGGTKAQILSDPWKYAVDERELSQVDWEIKDVTVDGDEPQVDVPDATLKDLGKVAYEACEDGGQQNWGPWNKAPVIVRHVHDEMAAAVAQEVLLRQGEG